MFRDNKRKIVSFSWVVADITNYFHIDVQFMLCIIFQTVQNLDLVLILIESLHGTGRKLLIIKESFLQNMLEM